MSELFIRRPVATTLAMLGIFLLGVLGYRSLPVSALPDVDFPTIEVSTVLPGASAPVMEQTVTNPLEKQLGRIPGLVTMSSRSSYGRSSITLRFSLNQGIDAAAQDVQAALTASSSLLPPSLPRPPVFSKVNPADAPILVLALRSDRLPPARVYDFAETVLVQRLSQTEGVGRVSVQGGQNRAIRIEARPDRLASLGLTLADLSAAIERLNVNAPKGSLEGAQRSFTLAANDKLVSAPDYEAAVIAYRDGAPVRLGDVASVSDSVEDDRSGAWVGDQPALLLEIQRQPGANVIATVQRIQSLLAQLAGTAPAGLDIAIVNDRTVTIRASIAEVEFTLVLSVVLVILVIWLYLRKGWATAIPSVVLPLSVVGTFGIMAAVGFSLNNLTLVALTAAAGFLVDDAIVMIENVTRHIERGLRPVQAAIVGAREIAFTIVSLSVSLVAVFFPLVLMGGVVGRLFREFSLTLTFAVAVSAIISLTLTPMMCARFLSGRRRGPAPRPHPLVARLERALDVQADLYRASLDWVFAHRAVPIAFLAATLALTAALYVAIPKSFLPEQDTGMLIATTEAAPDASFASVAAWQRRLVERLSADPDVASVVHVVGQGSATATLNAGRLFVNLRAHRDDGLETTIERLRRMADDLPGIAVAIQTADDLQLGTELMPGKYQLALQDPDKTTLSTTAIRLGEALRRLPELRDVSVEGQQGTAALQIRIRREEAARLGVTVEGITQALYDAFGQRQVSTMYTDLSQFPVVMAVDPADRTAEDDLRFVHVPSALGQAVPLSALADVVPGSLPLVAAHLGRTPAILVSFNLGGGVALGTAIAAVERTLQEIELPASVGTRYLGAAAEFTESHGSQLLYVLGALVVVYIVLGVLYESFVHPVTILSTLPSAGFGALLLLWLMGYHFDMIALIGVIMLIGIVKKNAIMMVDFAREREAAGQSAHEAIRSASLLRFRPIMMTTMAALIGALPLAFGHGPGAELRQPLGITLLGGLMLSQLLTLYTTPVIYVLLSRFERRTRSGVTPDAGDREAVEVQTGSAAAMGRRAAADAP